MASNAKEFFLQGNVVGTVVGAGGFDGVPELKGAASGGYEDAPACGAGGGTFTGGAGLGVSSVPDRISGGGGALHVAVMSDISFRASQRVYLLICVLVSGGAMSTVARASD